MFCSLFFGPVSAGVRDALCVAQKPLYGAWHCLAVCGEPPSDAPGRVLAVVHRGFGAYEQRMAQRSDQIAAHSAAPYRPTRLAAATDSDAAAGYSAKGAPPRQRGGSGAPTLVSAAGCTQNATQLQARQRINLAWLMRLRWGAAVGQLAAIMITHFGWDVPLPMLPLLMACSLTIGSNLLVGWYARRVNGAVSEAFVGRIVALDIAMLTTLLYFTGGATNPFHFLYLVHMAVAAMTLSAAWLWFIVAQSFVGFGLLFVWHVPLALGVTHAPASLREQGMGAAFASASLFIVYFVRRLSEALAQSEAQLARARDQQARDEKLTSLATLAAGAAHELATPLATIAVVAKEMERQLIGSSNGLGSPLEDARLIRQEVERCRHVLTQMAFDAGASTGEAFVTVSVRRLLRDALKEYLSQGRVRIDIDPSAHQDVYIPQSSIAHALRAIVKNGLEASIDTAQPLVEVRATVVDDKVYVCVTDTGHGMPPDVLTRVSEPFFTTKGPGHGMGLGLFLTRTVLERLGGELQVESQVGRGTSVVLHLPATPGAHAASGLLEPH